MKTSTESSNLSFSKASGIRKFFSRSALVVGSIFLSLLLIELLGQIGYRILKKEWLFWEVPLRTSDFMESHPWLVAAPKPNASGKYKGLHIHHNSYGFRGGEFAIPKASNRIRIVTLGGSSTYCTGVSNDETWPHQLQQQLGEGYEVINLGVLGYTTAEHIIQTTLMLSELQPDIAIYYEGWNDARNTHVKARKPDYADFHGRSEYFNHALYEFPGWNWSVTVLALKKSMRWALNPYGYRLPEPGEHPWTTIPDQRALGIYARNLQLIAACCRELKIKPIFMPQVMNYAILDSEDSYSWLPFVKDKEIEAVIRQYNLTMRDVAKANRVDFLDDVLRQSYTLDDFVARDPGHFSPKGCQKIAAMLAPLIRKKSASRNKNGPLVNAAHARGLRGGNPHDTRAGP